MIVLLILFKFFIFHKPMKMIFNYLYIYFNYLIFFINDQFEKIKCQIIKDNFNLV